MTTAQVGAALRHIRALATARSDHEPPDEQLLGRFAAHRDEVAFAALLRRHGPMVLGVTMLGLGRSITACQSATNWRAELPIRFGVILRKVWGGSRTWVGTWPQAVLMSVWRTCWQQGRSALDFRSQLLRGMPAPLALPCPTARSQLC
jgi:hypothetical protein